MVQTTGHHCCHAARQLQHVAAFNVKTLYPCPKLLKTIKSEKTKMEMLEMILSQKEIMAERQVWVKMQIKSRPFITII